MDDQEKTARRGRAEAAWARMRLHKKVGFVCGILAGILGVITLLAFFVRDGTVAWLSVVSIFFAVISCYYAVKYGDQY